jgi:hypothetical protein
MRKVVFGGANSLDNYFARKDHSTDWLRWSHEAAAVTAACWKTFDTRKVLFRSGDYRRSRLQHPACAARLRHPTVPRNDAPDRFDPAGMPSLQEWLRVSEVPREPLTIDHVNGQGRRLAAIRRRNRQSLSSPGPVRMRRPANQIASSSSRRATSDSSKTSAPAP